MSTHVSSTDNCDPNVNTLKATAVRYDALFHFYPWLNTDVFSLVTRRPLFYLGCDMTSYFLLSSGYRIQNFSRIKPGIRGISLSGSQESFAPANFGS